MSRRTRIAPIVIAASATLNAQKCELPQYVHEIDHVPDERAVDEIAEGPAENQREPEPRHPLVKPSCAP